MKIGKVYLVGAGPGDESLITLKGKRCIQEADVVLYDRLVNPVLLQYVKPNAELIYCGKLPDRHTLRQEGINALLVEKGLAGKIVVRLKGGDPSVFGRVGEEATALAEHNIPFEIVPGITSSIGAAAYAGIPLTHRDFGCSFAFVTGHDKSTKGEPTIDWKALATGIDTIAFYMGVANLDHITSKLTYYGKSPDTSVIIIQWGTYSRQTTVEGTLATIVDKAKEKDIQNPAMTLVGPIVQLREKMAWFEKSELFGREILFARTGMERSEMAEGLKRKGAEVVNFPQFEKIPLHHLDIFKQGLETAVTENADILFLSSESVHHFFEGLHLFNVDIRNVRGRFFTGSIKSMRALAKYGCIGQEWSMSFNGSGKLIIFAEEKDKSSETLTEKYGVHQYIATHKNVLNKHSQVILDRILADGNLNTMIFPSAASVLRVMEGLSEQGKQLIMGNPNIEVICFGEQSAKMAISQNFNISHILTKPTSEHLLNYLTEKAGGRV